MVRLSVFSVIAFFACNPLLASPEFSWKYDSSESISQRIEVPRGFQRVPVTKGSFAEWLRFLPVKTGRPPVMLFNGQQKGNQDAHHMVIDVDVGKLDLQQCADAIMRLRAEYLYSIRAYSQIQFSFTSGDVARYADWRAGYRPIISGNHVLFRKTRNPDSSYEAFRSYLNKVFEYAGSYSLSKEMISVNRKSLQIGDVFIQGAFPGHAVLVVDLAENPSTKQRVYLLLQSYMPAQEMHILRNPEDTGLSPWYDASVPSTLETPEWTFRAKDLKRFKEK